MPDRARTLLALTVALGLTAAVPAPEGNTTFETLRLSAEVARAGAARNDPYLLLAAARLRQSTPVTLDPDAADRALEWIARAEQIGGEDPRIGTIASDLRAEAKKGRREGPRISQAVLRGGERRLFSEVFRAGRPAVVYIEGDGDTDLMLKVGTACRDVRPGDVKICAWTPATSEKVTVEIGNPGRVENRVILGTN